MRLVTTVPQTFWGLLHTAKKFGNGLFTPKCVNCFPSTSYVGEINNATISGQFGYVIEELGQGNHVIFVTLSFSKVSVSTRVKTRSRRFNLNGSGLKRVFKKLPLSWRISFDGRPNRRDKAAFSNFIGVVWTSSRKPLKWNFQLFKPVYMERGSSQCKGHPRTNIIRLWYFFTFQFTCEGLYLGSVLGSSYR